MVRVNGKEVCNYLLAQHVLGVVPLNLEVLQDVETAELFKLGGVRFELELELEDSE